MLDGAIDIFERKGRNNMLRILGEKKRNQFYKSMTGKNLEVLFESENMAGFIKGFSSNYVRVSNKFDESLGNTFTNVKITGIIDNNCTGIIENKEIELVA